MSSYRIQVDGKAHGWQRAGKGAKGNLYTQEQTRQAKTSIQHAAKIQIGTPLVPGPVEFFARYYFEVPPSWSDRKRGQALRGEILHTTKPDFDNLGKLTCDALNNIAWKDDAQVQRGVIEKHYAERPGTDILITELRQATDGTRAPL
jgi:Holliday junction resolvase RusA-like endonuclease